MANQNINQVLQDAIMGINAKYIQQIPLEQQIAQYLQLQRKNRFPQLVVGGYGNSVSPQLGLNGMTQQEYDSLIVGR